MVGEREGAWHRRNQAEPEAVAMAMVGIGEQVRGRVKGLGRLEDCEGARDGLK